MIFKRVILFLDMINIYRMIKKIYILGYIYIYYVNKMMKIYLYE